MPESITKLETRGLSLSETLKILNGIRYSINRVSNEIGIAINKKMENVLKKNNGLKTLRNMSKIMNDEKTKEKNIPEDFIF